MKHESRERTKPLSFLMRLFAARFTARGGGFPEAAAATGQGQRASPSKKILIVDDDALVLKTISLKLRARGYAVVTAMDGPGAISAVRAEKPDLILLDITLPQHVEAAPWDGLLVISWLRRLEDAKHIPVIVITGGDPIEYKNRSLAAGALAFFHKPIDHTDLLSAIDRSVSPQADSRHPGCAP